MTEALQIIGIMILATFLTGQCYMLGKRRGAHKYSELVIKLLETDSKLLQKMNCVNLFCLLLKKDYE